MKIFNNKVAVITGAASGIGLASAYAFAKEGMKIALLDNRPEALKAATEELSNTGTEVSSFVVDVSDAKAVDAVAQKILVEFGAIHLLMNNAAVFIRGPEIAEVEDDVWDWLLKVNLYGPIHCVRSFLPSMQAHGEEGHIINTGSISGFIVGTRKNGVYATSKFALVAYTEALAHDLKGTNIGISVTLPAAVASDFYLSSAEHRGDLGGPNLYPTTPTDTANGMPPAEVAARVVEGVRNEQLYIATHTATRSVLEGRHEKIMAAYDAAEKWDTSNT